MAWNVVIAGGGFGGFYAARTLERVLPPHSARIRLVNDVNFMLYTPLLPGAAAARSSRATSSCRCASSCRRRDLRLGHIVGASRSATAAVENLEGASRSCLRPARSSRWAR